MGLGTGTGVGFRSSGARFGKAPVHPALITAPGAALVYDFAQRSSLTLNAGNISAVNDLSGNSNGGTAASGKQPFWNTADSTLNNVGSCNPTSGTPQLALPAGFTLTEPWTIIVVAVTGNSGFQQILANPGPSAQLTANAGGTIFAQVGGDTASSASLNTTTKHIYVLQGNTPTNSTKLFVDSSSSALITHTQSGSTASSGISLCSNGGSFLVGSIGWFAVWNSIYTGSNLTATVNALGSRYGITVT